MLRGCALFSPETWRPFLGVSMLIIPKRYKMPTYSAYNILPQCRLSLPFCVMLSVCFCSLLFTYCYMHLPLGDKCELTYFSAAQRPKPAYTLRQFFFLHFSCSLAAEPSRSVKCSVVVKCLIRVPAEVATFWCGSACGHFTTNSRQDGPCPCVPVAWIRSA